MKLIPNLIPFNLNYPTKKNIPQNLLNSEISSQFIPTTKLIPFKEQYNNEIKPHIIRHIHYQFGVIGKRKVIQFFFRKTPYRMVYNNASDKNASNLMEAFPPNVSMPNLSVSSSIARILRENALKWIVEAFFSELNYISFDEPILDGVNPDCFIIPSIQANKILDFNEKYKNNPNELVEIELKDAIFVEIKAYHKSCLVGEKELLQAFNYAQKGGKALLITTGTIGTFETVESINKSLINTARTEEGVYDLELFQKFMGKIKSKYRGLIKKIDMREGQDSFDTRGIYISESSKLKKMYKYTKGWPDKIEFKELKTPNDIMEFLSSNVKLGIVHPDAFESLLKNKGLTKVAALLTRISDLYLEEIILNPTLLYPR